jgi:hypothetical protein
VRASTSLPKPRLVAGALIALVLLFLLVLLITPSAVARSRDQTPPKFDGLVSAITCIPGPIWDGRMTSYHLSWNPATDNRTRQQWIVYYIYIATEPGGQDFTQPYNWTPPGATSFDTDPLPSTQRFYFVVRAQDRAENIDTNTVEREGQNLCV